MIQAPRAAKSDEKPAEAMALDGATFVDEASNAPTPAVNTLKETTPVESVAPPKPMATKDPWADMYAD